MKNATITMPYADFDKMITELRTLRQAADDRSMVIASYHGYEYHIVNADAKLTELLKAIETQGIIIGKQNHIG